MKRFVSTIAALILTVTGTSPAAYAETVLGAQIAQGDVTLTKSQSPYRVTGLIQLREGQSFIIEPGVTVTFASGSGISSLGDVRIGSIDSPERVRVNIETTMQLVGNGSRPKNISVARTDIFANDSQLFQGCQRLDIVESYIEKVSQIVAEPYCPSVSIKDSYLSHVRNVYERYHTRSSFFELENNIIVSMSAICCRIPGYTMGATTRNSVFTVKSNEFRDLSAINLPYGYRNYSFEGNNFLNVKSVVAGLGDYWSSEVHHYPTSLSNNYWGGSLTDGEIRKSLGVIDGSSDIRNPVTVVFEPVAQSAFSVSGFPASHQAAIDKAAADKAPDSPKRYKNCAALQKVYAGGVALSSKSVNKGGKIKLKPTVNAKVYNLNKSLDRDKDGLACER